jgi:Caudovirus prohead serine protease
MRMRVAGTLTADLDRRQLHGRLLPWNTDGATSRGVVRFAPGSVRVPADPAGVVLNMEHDPTRPVGRLVAASDDGSGLTASWSVGDTPLGDQVLREVAAGLRTGISVECSDLDLDWQAHTIRAASLVGAAVVVAPAFTGAQVELSASEWAAVDAVATPAAPVPAPSQPSPVPAPVYAAAPTPAVGVRAAARTQPGMRDIYEMLRAQHTGQATPEITAALADITRSANAWVQPSQYAGELWSAVAYQRVVIPAISSDTLTGYTVTGWRWLTPPVVAAWTGDKTAVPSNAAVTESASATAKRLAGAHDIDRVYRDFGDDSFFASYYAAMANSYALLSDQAALADLLAGASTLVGVPASSPWQNELTACISIAAAGGGRASFAFAGKDVVSAIAGTTIANAPQNVDQLGMPIIQLVPGMPAKDMLVGTKDCATFYELPGSPIRVEAVDLTKGGIDAGVFGYYADIINKAACLVHITGAVTLDAPAGDVQPPAEQSAPAPSGSGGK